MTRFHTPINYDSPIYRLLPPTKLVYSGWTKKSGPPIIIRLLCIKDKKFQNNSEIYTVPSR